MTENCEAANSVYQGLLEKLDSSLLENDFQKYLSCVALPHVVETLDGYFTIDTKEELEAIFDRTRRNLELGNVPGLTRHCLGAVFLDEQTITASHETRLISDQLIIQNSYRALSTLSFANCDWKIKATKFGCSSISLPVDLTEMMSSLRQ